MDASMYSICERHLLSFVNVAMFVWSLSLYNIIKVKVSFFYFVSTVGGAPLETVKQYIENQKTSQRQKDKMG